MAVPFDFLVSWGKIHKGDNPSLTYVTTLKNKNLYKTVEELLSSSESGKKVSNLRSYIERRYSEIYEAYQTSLSTPQSVSTQRYSVMAPTILGNKAGASFYDRLKTFIKDYFEVRLRNETATRRVVFKESFIPQPLLSEIPNDGVLASHLSVSSQTVKNNRDQCINECHNMLVRGVVVDSYSAEPSLVADIQLLKEKFGNGISYETACNLTGLHDDRTFDFLVRLFGMDLTNNDAVRIRAVVPKGLVNMYSESIGKVISFFREDVICIRYDEDVVPELKIISKGKDPALLESLKSIVLNSNEFIHYRVQNQTFVAMRWDLLQDLSPQICWIVFNQGAFNLKSAISSDEIVRRYNSKDYAGKYRIRRITKEQIRTTSVKRCWRLMNIGNQGYWMIRNSKKDEFNLKDYVQALQKPKMTIEEFIKAAKESGLIPIYPESTISGLFNGEGQKTQRGQNLDWTNLLNEVEALLTTRRVPLKVSEIASELFNKLHPSNNYAAFASSLRQQLQKSDRFKTRSGASPKDGVWVALPNMEIPDSYRDVIKKAAVELLRKTPGNTKDQDDLYKLFKPMVPNNINKASALSSIFADTRFFLRKRSDNGAATTITLNPFIAE